jgi:probable addiction module antidote protein
MPIKISDWDTAEYLDTKEDIHLYLEACFDEAGTDTSLIALALGDIATSKGMKSIARETGVSRESLERALQGEGNPSLATIALVLRSLGLQLTIKPLTVEE